MHMKIIPICPAIEEIQFTHLKFKCTQRVFRDLKLPSAQKSKNRDARKFEFRVKTTKEFVRRSQRLSFKEGSRSGFLQGRRQGIFRPKMNEVNMEHFKTDHVK